MKKYRIFLIMLSVVLFLPACTVNEERESLGDNSGIIIHDNIVVFPEPNGLVEVKIDTLGKDVPDTKKKETFQFYLSLLLGEQL